LTPGLAEEGRRQAYLAALGIPVWTARRPLAHAAAADALSWMPFVDEEEPEVDAPPLVADAEPAALAVWSEESTAGAAFSSAPAAVWQDGPPDDGPPLDAYLDDPDIRDAAQRGPQSGRGLSRQLQAPPPEPARPVTLPPVVVSDDDMQPVHFQFAFFVSGRQGLIIPRLSLLSPSEDKLLGNILQAMTGHRASPVPFQWPMVANHSIPRHRRAAREALGGFLARQGQGLQGLVVLGEHETELHALLSAATTLPVCLMAGLGMLLQQPMRKRDVWLALRN
jgi:hypothetical protein